MKANSVEFLVYGKYALFSDPINRVGGEKLSYQVPTYEALKGILSSIYWKPTIVWIIDEVKIMNQIRTESKGIRPINYSGGNTLSIYTYLSDVAYKVKAHFEWNLNRPELIYDRNENKHHNIAKRSIERGGRRDVFLGTRECAAYVESCIYEEEDNVYYKGETIDLGVMFHSFIYPDENSDNKFIANFWKPTMENGVIKFIRPEDCEMKREIIDGKKKEFIKGKNIMGVEDLSYKDEFGGEDIELDS